MYLGVDIGATKTLLGIGKSPLNIVEQKKFSTPADFQNFKKELRDQLDHLENIDHVLATTIAVPGQVDGTRLIKAGRLPWHNLDLSDEFSWFSKPTFIQNDACLGGLAEARFGAAQDAKQLLYVTISTGIGSGIIIDKSIPDFIPGSEGGHAIIDYEHLASFEELASGSAFYERYGQLGKDVHDPKIWRDYGQLLGTGIYNMMTLTEPDIIVIGGSMGAFFKHYQDSLQKQVLSLNKYAIPNPTIRSAKFPTTAVLRGCISYAQEQVNA